MTTRSILEMLDLLIDATITQEAKAMMHAQDIDDVDSRIASRPSVSGKLMEIYMWIEDQQRDGKAFLHESNTETADQ